MLIPGKTNLLTLDSLVASSLDITSQSTFCAAVQKVLSFFLGPEPQTSIDAF